MKKVDVYINSFLYFVGVDNSTLKMENSFLVFQASWKTNFSIKANLLLPVSIYVEKVSNYINIEDVYV